MTAPARIDLAELVVRAQGEDTYGMWVPKRDVLALVEAVQAAQEVAEEFKGGYYGDRLAAALASFGEPAA